MNSHKVQKERKLIITIVISVLVALVAGMISYWSFPQNLEYMAQDGLYQNLGVIPDDIKIIAVDEATLQQLGPYSDWDRSYFATVIQTLNEDPQRAPKVIGVDCLFSGTNDSEADAALVEACREGGNVIVATTLNFDSTLYQGEDGQYYTMQYVSDEGLPYESLAAVVDYGFTNAIFAEDGFVREVYTSIQYEMNGQREVYDSFSYKIASSVGEVPDLPTKVEISFIGNPGDFEIISMAKVLDGSVPEGYFKDCIVLIGAYEEGLMDSYRVPVNYSKEMYGVEMHANYIYGLLNNRVVYPVNTVLQCLLVAVLAGAFCFYIHHTGLRNSIIAFVVLILGYVLFDFLLFRFAGYKMNVLALPMGAVLAFLCSALFRYIEMQKSRMYEMQDMLFSMAEAMAETIEGRTPYNANHTKNVAKRCLEMLDYINLQHKLKKTDLYFTEDDKRQLYLAAMLHDVGKMDIPLEVMDKSTKLGNREQELRARLEIIGLRIENDVLNDRLERGEADAKLAKLNAFINNLENFICGRPLKEDEWKLVDEIAASIYNNESMEIPYLTPEEIEDLHITAGTLSEKERQTMQSHVTYTDKILAHIKFGEHFDRVRDMASNHHELLNGKGYPKGVKEEELDVMTRILTIMDIYDSLVADDRPYKKAKSVEVAFDILEEEAAAGKIDATLLQFARELYLPEGQPENKEAESERAGNKTAEK